MASIIKYMIPYVSVFSIDTYPISILFRYKLVTKDTLAMWFLEPNENDFVNIENPEHRAYAETKVPFGFRCVSTNEELYPPHPDIMYQYRGPLEAFDDTELFLFEVQMNGNVQGLPKQ